ncbi:ribosome assembly cofactor RimP [Fulvivirga lutea]|uniref:ribosome assembly cofactor RimP n=1 Tax=Fulvivirga lutea TaxID=2810512 RepID=UPI001F20C9BC|nr:ribosome assembly cofactor RimP [Fulvivirga lutea]
MENLKSIVTKLAEANLTKKEHFLVDVIVSADKGPTKITILLDGDEGVTIDDCAEMSRAVGFALEEDEIVDSKYTLEVTSPGVDFPLDTLRQYKKNIGRKLKISTTDGKDIKGILKEVSEKRLLLDKEVKKGKKVDHVPLEMSFDQIKRTIVQVSFK